jgi:hypothetical protein
MIVAPYAASDLCKGRLTVYRFFDVATRNWRESSEIRRSTNEVGFEVAGQVWGAFGLRF